MSEESENYILGDRVTEVAKDGQRETAVLSVRLSLEEMAALESRAVQMGKTVSQVAREALRQWLATPQVTIPIRHAAILEETASAWLRGKAPTLPDEQLKDLLATLLDTRVALVRAGWTGWTVEP